MAASPLAPTARKLFELLDDCGVTYLNGEIHGLEADQFSAFLDRYRAYARDRDVATRHHLNRHETLFRTYLRPSDRSFSTAYQILWYMDEIVMRDPLAVFVRDGAADTNSLQSVRHNLRILFDLRPYIEAGYIVLGGDELLAPLPDAIGEDAAQLGRNVDIVDALDRVVRLGLVRRRDSRGNEWVLFDAHTDTEFRLMFFHPSLASGTHESPGYVFGDRLPQTTAEEIAAATNQSVDEVRALIRGMYPREVAAVLHAAALASDMEAAMLFDREADAIIFERAATVPVDHRLQAATSGVLDLALPYLEGASSEQLLELRADLPDAFREFRARMENIVSRAMKDEPQRAQQEARLLAEREVVPSLRGLEAELAASARKHRIMGWGGTALSVVAGSLVGILTGNLTAALAPLLGGLGTSLSAAAASAGDQRSSVRNPFYFVWRARRRA